MRILANNFELIDLKKIAELPRNLTSTLLKVISKRGYITDNNIQIVCIYIYIINYQFDIK